MKTKLISRISALMLMFGACVAAAAQTGYTTVRGRATDEQGKPYVGATIHGEDKETGRKFDIKTDKNGDYRSIGIASGVYRVALIVDGKEIWFINNRRVSLADEETVIDFDMKKEKASAAKDAEKNPPKVTEQQKAEMEKAQKENLNIKQLNELMNKAHEDEVANNFDSAIATMKQVSQLGSQYPLVWSRLGATYVTAAKKNTDPAAKKEQYAQAVTAFKKATEMEALPTASASDKSSMPEDLNFLGEALAQSGDLDGAKAAYSGAAAAAPANAARYWFNLGAQYFNHNKMPEAADAFGKAAEAKPDYAEAWFQKGSALLNQATMKGDKMVAPPGTEEAYQKYLELEPNGKFADAAKGSLQALGASIETSYGNKKKTTKK